MGAAAGGGGESSLSGGAGASSLKSAGGSSSSDETRAGPARRFLAPRARPRRLLGAGVLLWVHWRRIDRDALVVVVDVKLPVPSGTTAYHELVERLNANIVRAIKEAEADLCLPTSRRI